MKQRTIITATFFHPGSFVGEQSTVEVETRDPAAIKFPESAYAFQLYERTDLSDGPEVWTGQSKKLGPMYFHPDSKVETLEEVKKNPKATGILLSNMEMNGWKAIVWSRWGNWPQPWDAATDAIQPKA